MYLNGSFWKSEIIVLQCEFGSFWRWKLLDLISGEDIIVWASHKDIALSTFRGPDESHKLRSGT
jgi:hypothetical protein